MFLYIVNIQQYKTYILFRIVVYFLYLTWLGLNLSRCTGMGDLDVVVSLARPTGSLAGPGRGQGHGYRWLWLRGFGKIFQQRCFATTVPWKMAAVGPGIRADTSHSWLSVRRESSWCGNVPRGPRPARAWAGPVSCNSSWLLSCVGWTYSWSIFDNCLCSGCPYLKLSRFPRLWLNSLPARAGPQRIAAKFHKEHRKIPPSCSCELFDFRCYFSVAKGFEFFSFTDRTGYLVLLAIVSRKEDC